VFVLLTATHDSEQRRQKNRVSQNEKVNEEKNARRDTFQEKNGSLYYNDIELLTKWKNTTDFSLSSSHFFVLFNFKSKRRNQTTKEKKKKKKSN